MEVTTLAPQGWAGAVGSRRHCYRHVGNVLPRHEDDPQSPAVLRAGGGGQDLGPPLVNVAPSLPLCPAQSAVPTAHPETSGQSLGSSWEHHLTALETQRESGQRTGAGVL